MISVVDGQLGVGDGEWDFRRNNTTLATCISVAGCMGKSGVTAGSI